MQTGVSAIHATSQTRLNGNPKTVGVIRSHHGTEKQMAVKGIKPTASAPRAGGGGDDRGMAANFQPARANERGKWPSKLLTADEKCVRGIPRRYFINPNARLHVTKPERCSRIPEIS